MKMTGKNDLSQTSHMCRSMRMRRQRSKTRQRERARGVTCSLVHVLGICEDVLCELRVIVVVVTFTSILSSVLDVVVDVALVDVLAV